MTRFLVVPQWQGSPSSRAMQLIDGAHAIAGDLPRSKTTVVNVPLEAGESLGTDVRRLSSIVQVARLQLEVAASDSDSDSEPERIVTIGGDAGVATTAALDAIGAARGELDTEAVVVWFSAQPSLDDPATSASKAYESMAAGALIGSGAPVAAEPPLLSPDRLVLVGVRDASDDDVRIAKEHGVRFVSGEEVSANPAAVAELVTSLGARSVFIHVALDVLDPSVITGITNPTPFGLDVATVTAAVRAIHGLSSDSEARVTGAALTGFAPASPEAAVEDLGTILRIVGALA